MLPYISRQQAQLPLIHRVQQPRGKKALNLAGDALSHRDRKSTRLNSSHGYISYAVFCLKKKKNVVLRWLRGEGNAPALSMASNFCRTPLLTMYRLPPILSPEPTRGASLDILFERSHVVR